MARLSPGIACGSVKRGSLLPGVVRHPTHQPPMLVTQTRRVPLTRGVSRTMGVRPAYPVSQTPLVRESGPVILTLPVSLTRATGSQCAAHATPQRSRQAPQDGLSRIAWASAALCRQGCLHPVTLTARVTRTRLDRGTMDVIPTHPVSATRRVPVTPLATPTALVSLTPIAPARGSHPVTVPRPSRAPLRRCASPRLWCPQYARSHRWWCRP